MMIPVLAVELAPVVRVNVVAVEVTASPLLLKMIAGVFV
jgi:hypothetical protein